MNKYIYIFIYILSLNVSASEAIIFDKKIHVDTIDTLCLKDKSIISGSFDGNIKKTVNNESNIIGKHEDWIRKVICTDSNIISASNDGHITIWKNFKKINSVKAHSWWITDIALTDDKIFSISFDESVKLWSYPQLKLLYSKKIDGSNKHHSLLINDGHAYIGSTSGAVFVFDINNFIQREIIIISNFHSTVTSSTKLDENMFFGTSNGYIVKVSTTVPRKISKFKISQFAIKALTQYKGDLYIGDDQGVIRRVSSKNIEVSHELSRFPESIRVLIVDENKLYAGYDEGYIRIFDNN